MITPIIWFWALLCPNHSHTILNHGTCQMVHVTTQSLDDTIDGTVGETGNFPPKPPVPPPPPPPPGN